MSTALNRNQYAIHSLFLHFFGATNETVPIIYPGTASGNIHFSIFVELSLQRDGTMRLNKLCLSIIQELYITVSLELSFEAFLDQINAIYQLLNYTIIIFHSHC